MNYTWVSTVFVFAGLLMSGCSTYLGYHHEAVLGEPKERLVATNPPHSLAVRLLGSSEASSVGIEVCTVAEEQWVIETPIRLVKRKKYARYGVGSKLKEAVDTGWKLLDGSLFVATTPLGVMSDFPIWRRLFPSLRFYPPVDLAAKILGSRGVHKASSEPPRLFPDLQCLEYDEVPPGYLVRLSQNSLLGGFNPFQCAWTSETPVFYKDTETAWHSLDATTTTRHVVRPTAGRRIQLNPGLAAAPIYLQTDEQGIAHVDAAQWKALEPPCRQTGIIVSLCDETGGKGTTEPLRGVLSFQVDDLLEPCAAQRLSRTIDARVK